LQNGVFETGKQEQVSFETKEDYFGGTNLKTTARLFERVAGKSQYQQAKTQGLQE
jgi:hypothetical protein